MLRIGNVDLASSLLLSPMAGYCDLAFRLTIRPLGGLGLASTDLVNPRGLLRRTRKSMELVRTDAGDRPLCVQLYGAEPAVAAEAARWCAEQLGAAVIDLNMGCPVDKVCKRDAGSALLRDERLALRLAERVVSASPVPVTVKMRLGWDDDSIVAPRLAADLEDVGVAAVTVHGRTAVQRFRGASRLDGIARVVERVCRIPVIGNGDVRSPTDAAEMLRRTGCAGVMIGRGALRYPWIFRDTASYLATGCIPEPPTVRDWARLMDIHFDHLVRLRGERVACIIFRQRAGMYGRKLGPCWTFREGVRSIRTAAEYRALTETIDTSDLPASRPAAGVLASAG